MHQMGGWHDILIGPQRLRTQSSTIVLDVYRGTVIIRGKLATILLRHAQQ